MVESVCSIGDNSSPTPAPPQGEGWLVFYFTPPLALPSAFEEYHKTNQENQICASRSPCGEGETQVIPSRVILR
jgi:hypothetical protein